MSTTFDKKSITDAFAREMIGAAAAEATALGVTVNIAVLDESGVLKAFLRMDRAPLISIDAAIAKAKTALSYGKSTDAWYETIESDPRMAAGVQHMKEFSVLGGGYPIALGDEVIGGIGVSGGGYTNDMKCAQAALALLD